MRTTVLQIFFVLLALSFSECQDSITEVAFRSIPTSPTSGENRPYSIATTSSGYSYVVGEFTNSNDFGGQTVTANTARTNAYLAKYDFELNLEWVLNFTGDTNGLYTTQIQSNGDIIVAGNFAGATSYAGLTKSPKSSRDTVLAKFLSNGSLSWTKQFGVTGSSTVTHMTIGPNDTIAICVVSGGTQNFGGANISVAGFSDAFYAVFDSEGNHIYSTSVAGSNEEECGGVALDSEGSLIGSVTTYSNSPLVAGQPTGNTAGDRDILLFKIDSNGTLLWYKRLGSSTAEGAADVATDSQDNIILTGFFGNGGLSLGGPTALPIPGSYDIFLVKYNKDGLWQWQISFGNLYNNDFSKAIQIGDSDGIYLTGTYESSTAGNVTLPSVTYGAFLVKFTSYGILQWDISYNSSSAFSTMGISVASSAVVFAGQFQSNANSQTNSTVAQGPVSGLLVTNIENMASPSPTPSPFFTPSITPSRTPSPSVTPSVTPSRTPSRSPTPSVTPTSSVTPTVTPSPVSPSATPSTSVTPSVTPSISSSPSRTPSVSSTPTKSITPSITSTPSVGSAASGGKTTNPGAVAGAVVGSVVGVVALIGFAFLVMKKRKRGNSEPHDLEENNTTLPMNDRSSARLSNELYIDDIQLKGLIGSGKFGEVYEGLWHGTTAVACKKLTDDDKEEFENEIRLLMKLNHPNVVRCLGIYLHPSDGEIFMVLELLRLGSLSNFLRNPESQKKLAIADLIEMCVHAASGMVFLEQKNIVHRDLGARNILVTEMDGRYVVKIADFGLSRQVEENYAVYSSKEGVFPVKWSPPEVIKFRKFTSKSDVWSFAVTMWEIFELGTVPYPTMSNDEAVDQIMSGYRLPRPASCPEEVYQLMLQCWSVEPGDRPNFKSIHEQLLRILKSLTEGQEDIIPASEGADSSTYNTIQRVGPPENDSYSALSVRNNTNNAHHTDTYNTEPTKPSDTNTYFSN